MQLLAPIHGIVIPLERVPDPVFAQKIVGEGVGIDPTSNTVVAPCEGVIAHLHPAHHAVTLRTAQGIEILIHIGIDTVNLRGQGFRALVKQGEQVKIGQKLIEFDEDIVASKAKSLITLMIVADPQGRAIKVIPHDRAVAGRDLLIEISEAKGTIPVASPRTGKDGRKTVRVPFATGLHARPAAQLVQLAKSFQSIIQLKKNDRVVNAKSVVNVMSLEAEHGDQIEIVVSGVDSEAALQVMEQFFAADHAVAKPLQFAAFSPRSASKDARLLRGIGISSGVVLGKIHQLHAKSLDLPTRPSGSASDELKSIQGAIIEAQEQLTELAAKTATQGLTSEAKIFEAHQEILEDPEIQDKVKSFLDSGDSAAMAWNKAIQFQAQALSQLKNDLLAQRATDLRDAGLRVLKVLVPKLSEQDNVPEDSIIVSEAITPSDVASFDLSRVVGFCSVTGNATSHAAILARSLGIPAIFAIDARVSDLEEGLEVLLDAENGMLNAKASKEEIDQAQKRQTEIKRLEADAMKHAFESAKTPDGRKVEVHANISGVADAKKAIEKGADGVGLLRTEFLFLEKSEPPSEDEQLKVYQEISDILGERPLTIRTLDVGGDKPPAFIQLPKEDNPFLGIRGIRVSFLLPELFRTQIRAILRVKSKGPLNMMFPMIATLEEFHRARQMVQEEMQTHPNPKVHLGVMVEVPSVALTADAFAREVEFFSIGTNDLTQYTLAMDRGNQNLVVDPLHPSLFSLIQMTVEAAHRNNRWVGVCGDLASQPKAIAKLVAIGVDELSVAPPTVALVKAQVRERNPQ